MKLTRCFLPGQAVRARQKGLVLFFALIALVVLSLAAVALIRSVDTSTLIAGNLAFKQSATVSADAGVEAGMNWLATIQTANSVLNAINNPDHPFNQTDASRGYYSSVTSVASLFDDAPWNAITAVAPVTDGSGNTVQYIIQRMCRNENQPIQSADCLFSSAVQDNSGQQVRLPQDVCSGAGCPSAGQSPQIRITSRTRGPRNTVSYVQAFVY